MRLLNVRTLAFENFIRDEETPKYAILSHTWGDEEVTYKDMRKYRDKAQSKEGFRKIELCAKQALGDGLEFCWVDTCCINQSSSAELSEAINSMFRWYQNAEVCYTYLSDTQAPEGEVCELDATWIKTFRKSRWFTRGWTLQELIAPMTLIFFSKQWTKIGTKESLRDVIESFTGVPAHILMNYDLSRVSVAQRMSWAAHRVTSRTEDIAYCLMGIFDVNMPMLYGEGEKAFIRLQEEIIKTSDDISIFSWCDPKASFSTYRGLLARSPSDFAQCKDVEWVRTKAHPPYQITNKGIKMDSKMIPRESRDNEYIAPLWGVAKKAMPNMWIGIYLQKIGEDQYARIQSDQIAIFRDTLIGTSSDPWSTLFIRQKIVMERLDHSRAAGIFFLLDVPNLTITDVHPSDRWNKISSFFSFEKLAAEGKPPQAVFSIKGSTGFNDMIITVAAERKWGQFITVSGGWNTQQTFNSSIHRVYCRKPSLPTMVLSVHRGLFGDESRIVLEIKEGLE